MLEPSRAPARLTPGDPAVLDQRIAAMLEEAGQRARPADDAGHALGGLRAIPVLSDNMQPTLRRGDFVFAAPVTAYEGEGIYATADPFGTMTLHRFESCGRGRIRMWSDNPLYSRFEISRDEFLAMLVAKVVVTAKVVDPFLLPDALRV